MAIPLIARGAAALAKKGLKKLGQRRSNLTKKEKAEGPLADTKPRRKTRVSKKKQTERRAANEAAAVKRGAKRFGAGAAGTAAVGTAGVAATRGKGDEKPETKKPEPKKPVAKKTENTRKSTAPTLKAKKKTVEQRLQDADRRGPVGTTRITGDKGTKRFLERDKLRKTAKIVTDVEKPPTPPKSDLKSSRTTFKGDRPTTTVRSAQRQSEAKGENKLAGTFRRMNAGEGKFEDKAAVTKEDLDAWRKRTGNEDLGYKESLRGLLNEARGKTRRGMMKGGAVKKPFKTGDLVKAKPKAKKKVRGAGKEIKGLRPCKMR